MRHRSQAFHTRLCLPSPCCEWVSRVGEGGRPWVLVRFRVRCAALTGLEAPWALLGTKGFESSSLGGVGRPSMTQVVEGVSD